jgi:two-component system response regulator PilR (NtrC family)
MSQRILVVDDDEVLGQVLKRVLIRQGYLVDYAAGVAEALELARDLESAPQLALLDLCLPDGDGGELAVKLQAHWPDLPLILITAYPLRLRAAPGLSERFTAVLTKPLSLSVLRQAIQTALEPPARAKGPWPLHLGAR